MWDMVDTIRRGDKEILYIIVEHSYYSEVSDRRDDHFTRAEIEQTVEKKKITKDTIDGHSGRLR